MQLFLLFLAWLAIAVGCHSSIRRYYLASFAAAFAMVAALQLASYLQTGRLDPLWPLTSLVGFCLAVIVALATGLPFRVRRIVREHHDDHPDA
jgi:peptidoglycan biosynthesis protein MviN/MurJ (putative lipid II flippase)